MVQLASGHQAGNCVLWCQEPGEAPWLRARMWSKSSSAARSSNRGSNSCSSGEKQLRTWAFTALGCVGRPMPTRNLGIACGGKRWAQRALVRHAGHPPWPPLKQCRTEGQTHTGVEAANAGTDSIVAPSRDMGEQLVLPWVNTFPPHPAQDGFRVTHSLGDWNSSPTPPQLGGQHPYPNPEHLRASPGTAPQLQSQFPQGLVQFVMYQVDLFCSQPKQLSLVQGNSSPDYCPSAQECVTLALIRRSQKRTHFTCKETEAPKVPKVMQQLELHRYLPQPASQPGPCAPRVDPSMGTSTHRLGPRSTRWHS